MRSRGIFLFFLALVLFSCRPAPPSFQKQFGLRVIRHWPSDGFQNPNLLVAEFNEPLAQENNPFTIYPAVEGHVEWVSPTRVVFFPQKGFPQATDFTVTLSAQLESKSGSILGQDFSWRFSTPPLQIVKTIPESGSLWLQGQPLVIFFNQVMDPKKALPFFKLESRGEDVAFKLSSSQGGRALQIEDLPSSVQSLPVSLVISGKLTGEEGLKPLGQDLKFDFVKQGGMEVQSFSCLEECDFDSPLTLKFSESVSLPDLEAKLKLTPSPLHRRPLVIDPLTQAVIIPWELQPNTTYQISFPAGLKSASGHASPHAFTHRFKTNDTPPTLFFKGKIASAPPENPQVSFEMQGVQRVELSLASLTEDQLVDLTTNHSFWDANEAPAIPLSWSETYSFPYTGPKRRTLNLSLSKALSTLGSQKGFFLCVASFTDGSGEKRFQKQIIQITPLRFAAKWSRQGVNVWLDGKYKSIEGWIRDGEGRLRWKGFLQGHLLQAPGFDKWEGRPSRGPYFLFVKTGEEESVNILEGEGEPQLPIEEKTWLTTHKKNYRSNELVRFFGFVDPPSDEIKTLSLHEANGSRLLSVDVSLDPSGAFSGNFILPENLKGGFYFISMDGIQTSFNIDEGGSLATLPSPFIVAAKKEFDEGEKIKLKINNPYAAARGLITLEKDRILSSLEVNLVAGENLVEIPYQENFFPGVEAGLVIIPNNGVQSMLAGQTPVLISQDKYQLHLQTEGIKTSYAPGESVNLSFVATDAQGKPLVGAPAFLWVVPSAQAPLLDDPTLFFHSPSPSWMATTHSQGFLAPSMSSSHSFPERASFALKQGSDDDFEIWDDTLKTDEKGHFGIQLVLPAQGASYQALALVYSKGEKYGLASVPLVVEGPLLLEKESPAFLREGDRLDLSLHFQNATAQSQKIIVHAKGEGMALEENEIPLEMAPKSYQDKNLSVRSQASPDGRVKLYWGMDNYWEEEIPFLIFPSGEKSFSYLAGKTNSHQAEKVIKDKQADVSQSELSIKVCPSFLPWMIEPWNHFLENTDLNFQTLLLKNHGAILADPLIPLEREPVQNFIENLIQKKLESFDPLTLHSLTLFLIDARSEGFRVPPEIFSNIRALLQQKLLVHGSMANSLPPSDLVMSLYDLFALGEVESSHLFLDELAGREDALTPPTLALLWEMAKAKDQDSTWVKALEQRIQKQLESDLTLLARYIFVQGKDPSRSLSDIEPLLYELLSFSSQRFGPTLSQTVEILRAIHFSLPKFSPPPLPLDFLVQRGRELLWRGSFNLPYGCEIKTLPLGELNDEELFVFQKQGEGELFYQIIQKTGQREIKKYESKGPSILRFFTDGEGKPVVGALKKGLSYQETFMIIADEPLGSLKMEVPLAAGLSLGQWQESTESLAFQVEENKQDLLISFSQIPAGISTWTYGFKASYSGNFYEPPASLNESQSGVSLARTPSQEIEITR